MPVEDDPVVTSNAEGDAAVTSRKKLSFVSTLFAMTCAGTLYLFSAYAQDLSHKLGFSQTQTNVIASCGGFGLYLSGPVFGSLVDRYPARKVVGLSGILVFAGYLSMALAYGRLISGHYLTVALAYSAVGLGSSGILNGCLVTNMRAFDPRDHGFAVGLSVAFFGLSAFVFSQLSTFFMVPIEPGSTAKALDTFHFLFFLALTTGGVTFASSLFLLDTLSSLRRPTRDEETSPLHPGTEAPSLEGAQPPARNENIQLFYILDAWLLFVAFLLVTGPGLMYINNIGAIVASLSTTTDIAVTQRLHVGLLSVFNCTGRIFTVLGLGYGAIFSSGPALVGAWFGIKHFGSNWG
ncbi:hypothetical protein HDU67_000991 [Dinochytrium kinnereticum]|nr:hypothetical protein HDU67_000991 [Dinochytrium kinnereticum]